MKILIFIGFFTGQILIETASANNPQRRVCLNNGAQFWSYKVQTPVQDNIGFCLWGQSTINSQSLIDFLHFDSETKAIQAFKQTRYTKVESCQGLSAKTILSVDSNNDVKAMCYFSDNSYISEYTLLSGWYSSVNYGLVDFLIRN